MPKSLSQNPQIKIPKSTYQSPLPSPSNEIILLLLLRFFFAWIHIGMAIFWSKMLAGSFTSSSVAFKFVPLPLLRFLSLALSPLIFV
ncbi:hypothetical protein FNV43_RR24700 [Rhamnella rubrinervis]|uniref:Uncharacterized protein n=1 Tax=Rhamnella rubrinervis TaxID=2594499 RepID=A0A8K0DR16_9ROSA|nr:hypothetical protein FNV43_RR24700 [Rhamnella rubrinervis]